MDDDAHSRRRRGAGVVTANACTECRKKRSKCDGQRPCYRCQSHNVQCIYAAPVRQSKDDMRSEIKRLSIHCQQSERVLSAITSGSRAQETLNRLRNGESLEATSTWLKNVSGQGAGGFSSTYVSTANPGLSQTLRMAESAGNYSRIGMSSSSEGPPSAGPPGWSAWNSSDSSRHASTPIHTNEGEDAMNWQSERHTSPSEEVPGDSNSQTGDPSQTLACRVVGGWGQEESINPANNQTQTARGRGQKHILGPTYTSEDVENSYRSWTEVTSDKTIVDHFMALYFCWEYPTFASLSKEHFLTDFLAGRPRYCSSILVNAMLALGCRFSTLPESRSNPDNSETAGDQYFAEVKKLLAEDDHTSLTTIQALGLIAIREASCGRDTESFYYGGQAIRLATEFGLHTEVTDYDKETPSSIDHEVRAATFWGAFALDQAWSLTLGRISHFSRYPNLVSKPRIIQEIEISGWVPYTDQGVADIRTASQTSNVRSVYKCFCELSELVHQSLYTLYTPGGTLTALDVNSIYTRYLNWYSDLPSSLRLGINFTPAVLFVHMYYHFAILMLFRPFIKLRFVGSVVSPSSVCVQAANAITTLVRSYDQLYTLQRAPSFVPYIVLASSITHLAAVGNSITVQIHQGFRDLKDMCSHHGFAQQGLNILRVLAQQWNLENLLEDQPRSEDQRDMKRVRDLCKPVTTRTNLFVPDMGDIFEGMRPAGSMSLFNPFPMQGVPLLAKEEELGNYGFARAYPVTSEEPR